MHLQEVNGKNCTYEPGSCIIPALNTSPLAPTINTMGKIEESILDNYKKALIQGDVLQAKRAVELAHNLKSLIENESFTDYEVSAQSASIIVGSSFTPIPYKFDPENGIIVIRNMAISLTDSESKLLSLLTQNETYEDNIKIIKKEEIKYYMWPNTKVTDNAVRIIIKRLRGKIEANPLYPQIILNYNKKGYVFVAKMIS